MNERLEKICFLPPPMDTPWAGAPAEDRSIQVQRSDGRTVALKLPLFWYDPPWSEIEITSADAIAGAVARLGVLVSALRSDLASTDEETELHGASSGEAISIQVQAPESLPRIIPYRPERYGLSDRDFDGAGVVDVRLAMRRNPTGRFAYTPTEIGRWEATQVESPLAGGGWVPAASFPPDVHGLGKLEGKLEQLRLLAGDAAVFVSMDPHRLNEELPAVLRSQPDGVIVRLNALELSGLELAHCVKQTRAIMDEQQCEHLPLWVVPGAISAADAAKLIALGANAVAIDSWCQELINEVRDAQQNATSTSGYSSLSAPKTQEWVDWVEGELFRHIERFDGLMHAMVYQPPEARLATLSVKWASKLSIPTLNVPFDAGS
ncbi:MAG: hypothetical protein CBD74_11785 [Saprospirales bacterium TMED214]|nr:MAG: hypothetical protein CBD74_11785 [Saprospirales bacterium TMED214]